MVQPASRRGVLFLTDSDNGLDTVDVIVARYIPAHIRLYVSSCFIRKIDL